MKAILISIRPQWVALILNLIKKDEIRKGTAIGKAINRLIKEQGVAPMLIYCTKGKPYLFKDLYAEKSGNEKLYYVDNKEHDNWSQKLNGKVVAHFNATVDMINVVFEQYCAGDLSQQGLCESSCLSFDELHEYLNGYSGAREVGTAIHITKLEIFDKPKEISEFKYYKKFSEIDYMLPIPRKETCERLVALTRAPQSWCWIEV